MAENKLRFTGVCHLFYNSLRIRLYVLRIRDYPDPFLFFSDGIGTRTIPTIFREGSGFLGLMYLALDHWTLLACEILDPFRPPKFC